MKVGDLVLCGTNKTLGVILSFDEEGDPVVYETASGITAAMWKYRVEVLNEGG